MNPFRPLLNAVAGSWAFFRESFLAASIGLGRSSTRLRGDDFARWEPRCVRYEIHWALSQNTAFKVALHPWAQSWKAANGVGKGARHVFNPCYELAEFWVNHIWGGALDPAAGDGSKVPSAIPIVTKLASLPPAIAIVLAASSWQVMKDVASRYGAVLADVFLQIVDDMVNRVARIEVVHPSEIRSVVKDSRGNVKAYERCRWVEDPDKPIGPDGRRPQCLYGEVCGRDGRMVTFQTFKDGKPYGWDGMPDSWTEPYGFVPMVHIQHCNIGLDFGLNAWHAGLSRFLEVDDQASSLGDAIRRAHLAPMLISGSDGFEDLTAPVDLTSRGPRGPQDKARVESKARLTMPFLYEGNPQARPWPLAATPDAAVSLGYMQLILDRIDRMFPEVVADAGLGGTVTAEAVRNARQLCTDKVQQVRIGYDGKFVAAVQMAIAIAGFRRFPGFEEFGLESFAAGELEFQVGTRDVFRADPRDELDDDAKFWAAADAATRAGWPLELFLEDAGWPADRIRRYLEIKSAAEAKAQARADADPGARGGAAA